MFWAERCTVKNKTSLVIWWMNKTHMWHSCVLMSSHVLSQYLHTDTNISSVRWYLCIGMAIFFRTQCYACIFGLYASVVREV